MAGIYIHIPFCKSRCIYCGFYSTTEHSLSDRYIDSLVEEMKARRDYLKGEPIHTIYIGGGTPSQLSEDELSHLVFSLRENFEIADDVEFAIECNPDDVTTYFASLLSNLGINRVSMGAQTFDDERLKFIRRRHASNQVSEAVSNLRNAGIKNISIDLMYGFPNETMSEWLNDIDKALDLNVNHISAYGLMIEEGTTLAAMESKGEISPANEETYRSMYYALLDKLESANFEHYEVSNFARHGYRSRHNSGYWHSMHYLGLGAAAHSYDGDSRQWNISDLRKYISGEWLEEREELSPSDKYDDMVMLRLRTSEGIDIQEINQSYRDYFLQNVKRFVDSGDIKRSDTQYRIARQSIYISDYITAELMMQ